MAVLILATALFTFITFLFIAFDYISTKYIKGDIEVVMDDELKNVDGIDNFIETLLEELSNESTKEYSKGKSKKEKEWAEKYWTFGKVTNVFLQHFEDDNSFSISVTAKKIGSYTDYQMIFGDKLDINEVEFRVHSINKSLFQPSFFVTYFSERNIPIKILRKFSNYKIAV